MCVVDEEDGILAWLVEDVNRFIEEDIPALEQAIASLED